MACESVIPLSRRFIEPLRPLFPAECMPLQITCEDLFGDVSGQGGKQGDNVVLVPPRHRVGRLVAPSRRELVPDRSSSKIGRVDRRTGPR